jgi:murein DD-endopeptidase MepM/ murein hydrolase activator NlpD
MDGRRLAEGRVMRLAVALALAITAALLADAPKAHAQAAQLAAARVLPPPPQLLPSRILRLARSDTLHDAPSETDVAARDAQAAIEAQKPVFAARAFNTGQEILLDFADALRELRFNAAIDRGVLVNRSLDGHFAAPAPARSRRLTRARVAGVIRSSLLDAASDAGLPMPVLAQMIGSFSYDIDFQRDLRPGDSFEVLYDRLDDEHGKAVGAGEIAYAAMTLSGRTIKLYRYRPAGAKSAEFFTQRGESAKKTLLRTPIDGARLSSAFGMRLHPILGYTAMHRGVDFAAPPGSPIAAASDGVVESAGPSGTYGNLVVLRHAGVVATAYAHMSRIARGMKPGVRVRQGEVIGYVGATGRATGPHLHFEIRIDGEPVDPVSIQARSGQPLDRGDVVLFRRLAEAVDRQVVALRQARIVAGAAGDRLDP